MKRGMILSLYLIRNLYRSLAGLAPLATMLGAYTITFYYTGNSVDYFAAVGGFDLALVCAVTTLVLASQANRAALYPMVLRLHRRLEFLAAVLMASLCVTTVIAVLFVALALGARAVSLTPGEMLVIAPRWLALSAFIATLSLHLSKLVGGAPSRIVTALLLLFVLGAAEWQIPLESGPARWLLQGVGFLASPLIANMMVEVHGAALDRYVLAIALPLAAACLLFLAAFGLFQRKDLLWTE